MLVSICKNNNYKIMSYQSLHPLYIYLSLKYIILVGKKINK